MNLSAFITDHLENILAAREAAGHDLPELPNGNAAMARERTRQLLRAVARETAATAYLPAACTHTAAQCLAVQDGTPLPARCSDCGQGALRQLEGATLAQLTGEFSLLRAVVLGLWLPQLAALTPETAHELLRFNQLLDAMLAEAASASAARALHDRDMFLAMLGHDLRSPLAAMSLAGQMLALPDVGTEPTRLVGARIRRSAASMTAMVTDLLQCARTQLGGTIPISPRPADMREICQAALEDAGAAHPDCAFELATSGELSDEFDSARLQQVLGNLLNNAVQYRTKGRPVTLSAEGGPDAIIVRVRNHGPVIPAASLQSIFDPLVQLPLEGTPHTRPPGSLGLGLFIARQITQAHGGTIQAQSDAASGTVFTLRLPRQHVAVAAVLVH